MNKLLLKFLGHPIIKYLLFTIYFLRFINPLFIFQFPVATLVTQYLLDYGDSLLGFYSRAVKWKFHYRIDKLLDYWFYIFVLIFMTQYPVFPIVLALFIYRTIGQFLSIKSYKEWIFVVFPNLFDLYFIVFVLSWYIPSLESFFVRSNNLLLLAILLPFSIIREYIIHMGKPIPKIFKKQWIDWKNETF